LQKKKRQRERVKRRKPKKKARKRARKAAVMMMIRKLLSRLVQQKSFKSLISSMKTSTTFGQIEMKKITLFSNLMQK